MKFVDAAYFSDFGVDVAMPGGATVRAVFDFPFSDAFGVVAASSPSLLLVDASASLAAVGDPVAVGGVSYTVTRIEPDGTGMTRMMITEA